MLQTHTAIQDLSRHEGEEVVLKGWVYQKRDIGKIRFLVIRDGLGDAGEMPPFADLESDENIWYMVNYLRSLRTDR